MLWLESAKAHQLNLVASNNGFNNHIDQGVQRLSGIAFGLPRSLRDGINQFRFVHSLLLKWGGDFHPNPSFRQTEDTWPITTLFW
jgi:hypothetical protein